MTNAEIVRVLAERKGWSCFNSHNLGLYGCKDSTHNQIPIPDYLNSHDALRPVLEKLTPEEWVVFKKKIWRCYYAANDIDSIINLTLTIQTPTLARLMAEAIVKCRKEPCS